ncbi:SSU ribosomal protein S30P/sigma 54 modulation protein [Carboxydocella sporoproducens DSM 16521]|uniref:Ribosome hibernation promoting factor n=2 Tax=Carboxydocella TaxID=178898 RepID=A0A1T4MDB9_9FIRM|nr:MULTISPECIES: ribosome-associated translation inhibitor RaiA [Carboxydocella]AVX21269.1 SSU ribosomal protein S30P /sigma 54 modulation protein [Carboxydocella thermautotrophica]AVX31701.1 SSU ribosomal protein S30P /sigma 54 modulation protein [Carboxydocella thermautotrophica]GAW29314.1 ribosomal subunit interface protein [Carboxydocella sp. ULO1]SJZ64922.1 SSU ribosomal protein S30P/sigma 54 modulation protein [Carboxydocella sporoproducens DSM 16521]
MKFVVRGKNIEVTDALRDYVEKRIGKLEKYLGEITNVQVTLVVEKNMHRVEVTIPVEGMIIRGEEASNDMYASIDLVVEKLERQVQKYRARLSKKLRNLASLEPVAADVETADIDDSVVKTKRFAVKPMPVEEAILQMNLVGHSFYVFRNADTNEVNVVYRRRDGKYGLIEPEF